MANRRERRHRTESEKQGLRIATFKRAVKIGWEIGTNLGEIYRVTQEASSGSQNDKYN